MSRTTSKRRWLQFSLRSLLLAPVVVAAWLSYEVHLARMVEREAQAIHDVGGSVEVEASRWGLLRFIEPKTYGTQIVAAQIIGESIRETQEILEQIPALREVRVVFNGVTDHSAAWMQLRSALPKASVIAVALPIDYGDDGAQVFPDLDISERRCGRFLKKIREIGGIDEEVIADVNQSVWLARGESWAAKPTRSFRLHVYTALAMPDGSLAEVLVVSARQRFSRAMGYALVLLVNDRCVDARHLSFMYTAAVVSIQDVNGDGCPDLAVEPSPANSRSASHFFQTLPSDPRPFLGLYAIEPGGFRNLLPMDPSKPRGAMLEETTIAEPPEVPPPARSPVR